MELYYWVPAGAAACLLLGACDQSNNYSGMKETELTGKYCDAKADQEKSCTAGDVIRTAEGREQLLCDWSWQVVHEPGGDAVLCVYRGSLRESRPSAGPE
ncbi:MAG TPA: hypothetical protein VJT80_03215 [Steroidobacteraceae bacterium]|nr:hypothetical protein [Steroidobacteraceae bacterium]